MKPALIHQILVTVLSVTCVAVTAVGFYNIYDGLSIKNIADINLSLDRFLIWGAVVLVTGLAVCLMGVFSNKIIMKFVSLLIFCLYVLTCIIVMASAYAKESEILDGFSYIFTDETETTKKGYESKAILLEETFNCCGWDNITQAIESEDSPCGYMETCRPLVASELEHLRVSLIFKLAVSLCGFVYCIIGQTILISTAKKLSGYRNLPVETRQFSEAI